MSNGASSKRTVIVMAMLLALMAGYIAWSQLQPKPTANAPGPTTQAPLAGANAISNLSVKQNDAGGWYATFDYFYTGQPAPAHVQVQIPGTAAAASVPVSGAIGSGFQLALRGQQHVTIDIQHPSLPEVKTTRSVTAVMTFQGRPIASQQTPVDITWPDWNTWARDRDLAGKTPEQVVDRAVALIDAGSRWELAEAKRLLERVLAKNPQADFAYVELARVAMKSNWGPEGLHQAEGLIQSALQIRADSANAKILLGYVFAHQGRYQAAEALFADAAKTPGKNLWLWANLGEVLAMQGKVDPAIDKYRETLARPPTRDTYDRARLDAYWKLLALLETRKDYDGMEALHKQRLTDYGPRDCHGAEYARFLLQRRGDSATAITLARAAVEAQCAGAETRDVLGLAYYVAWAGDPGPSRQDALNQARAFLPSGPKPLYLLATSERTAKVIPQLLAQGEQIDQMDNEKLNALAYALREKNLLAATRLMGFGARPDRLIGRMEMPIALVPVIEADIPAIQMFRRAGVDYGKLRFEGVSALDVAKRQGDRKLLDALDPQSSSL